MPKITPKIKICGITRAKDAELSVNLGADYLGFNFYKKSKRCILPEKAKSIISSLSDTKTKTVGVFVNHTKAEVLEIATKLKLDFLQFHGDESDSFLEGFSDFKIIKALRLKEGSSPKNKLNHYSKMLEQNKISHILFDSFSKDYGGSGKKINEELLLELKSAKLLETSFLAGGLTPENVADVVKTYQPFAVDVASGVEGERVGEKSEKRLREFFEGALRKNS